MQSLQDILSKFFKDSGLKNGVAINAIKRKWQSIVGKTIAAHTCPDLLRGKSLTLIVDTPQWMHHLTFYKEEIVGKLQPYNIENIRFRLGRLPEQATDTEGGEIAQLTEDDLRYIENTVGKIRDEDLQRKFRTLITHGLMQESKSKIKDKK
jgi:hypothetical protein